MGAKPFPSSHTNPSLLQPSSRLLVSPTGCTQSEAREQGNLARHPRKISLLGQEQSGKDREWVQGDQETTLAHPTTSCFSLLPVKLNFLQIPPSCASPLSELCHVLLSRFSSLHISEAHLSVTSSMKSPPNLTQK